jgi:hypothetical protein
MTWIFTSASFVSAVQLYNDPDRVMVRARDHESLRLFIESAVAANADTALSEDSISRDDKADYRYRAIFTKIELATTASYEILNFLTYHNFKEAATKVRGKEYHDALMGVWIAMQRMTRAEDGNPTPAGYHSFNDRDDIADGPSILDELDEMYAVVPLDDEENDELYHSLADMTDDELNAWMIKNG